MQGCIFSFRVVPCWMAKPPKYLEKRTKKAKTFLLWIMKSVVILRGLKNPVRISGNLLFHLICHSERSEESPHLTLSGWGLRRKLTLFKLKRRPFAKYAQGDRKKLSLRANEVNVLWVTGKKVVIASERSERGNLHILEGVERPPSNYSQMKK